MLPSYIFKQVKPTKTKDNKDDSEGKNESVDGIKDNGGNSDMKREEELKMEGEYKINDMEVRREEKVVEESDFNNNKQNMVQLRRQKSATNKQVKKSISRLSSAHFPPPPTTCSPPLPPPKTTNNISNTGPMDKTRPLSGDLGFNMLSSFVVDNKFNKQNNNFYGVNMLPRTITQPIILREDNNYNNITLQNTPINNRYSSIQASQNNFNSLQNTSSNSLQQTPTNTYNIKPPGSKNIPLYELSPPDSAGLESSGCLSPQSNLSPTPTKNFSPNQHQQQRQLMLLKQQKQMMYMKQKQKKSYELQHDNTQQYPHFHENLTGRGALFHNKTYNTSNNIYHVSYNNYNFNSYDQTYNPCLTPSPEYNDFNVEPIKMNSFLDKQL